jgi:tRNA/rRNA methyltransferase
MDIDHTATAATFGPAFVELGRRVRFVLVQPSHPGNIGASARAIRTMGFDRLCVVAPRVAGFAMDPEAVAFATNALGVMQAATVAAGLAEALAGTRLAFAMTGYAREFGPPLTDLRSAAARARETLAAGGEVAFVFGTERSGLSNEDAELCTGSCAIPVDPSCSSLNVAQAVQVAAYEMRLALHGGAIDPAMQPFADEVPASVDQVDRMLAHLEQALIALGYLDPEDPKRLMSRLRRLLGRARPTPSEIDILRGIAAAIVERKSERAGRGRAARR